jgi:hypothetical protein
MNSTTRVGALASTKIHDAHHDRLAVVYVRQSRPQQLIRHPESTRLQYGLVDRALALGWAKARVLWMMRMWESLPIAPQSVQAFSASWPR